jgi:signal transduction histidine kinase
MHDKNVGEEQLGVGRAPDPGPPIDFSRASLSTGRSFAPSQARPGVVLDFYSATISSDALPTAVVRLGPAGNIVSLDGQVRSLLGPARSLLGREGQDLSAAIAAAGDPEAAVVAKRLRQLLKGRLREVRCVLVHDGVALRLHAIWVGGPEPVLVIAQEVTEVLQLKEALADATRRLVLIREEERRNIAADLHDRTCQHLVALGFGLAALERAGAEPAVLSEMRGGLREVFKEIRTLSYLLYPRALAEAGLTATLKELARRYRLRGGVAVNLMVRGRLEELSLEMKQAVLLIAQEALCNAHRHADATRIRVSVTLGRKGLTVKVADDGHRAELGDFTPGVGLRDMSERTAQFGGRLSVEPGPSGATVSAFFPASSLPAG